VPRLFVAVDVALPGLGPGFDRPEGPAHLTLAFLGEVADARVPEVVAAVRTAAGGVAPFALAAGGVGAFPSPTRPRVVWAGLTEGGDAVAELARRIRAGLDAAGAPYDRRPFVPHITVLRVRREADRRLAAALLARPGGDRLGGRSVDAVDVKASERDANGARHTVVARLPLGGPPA
jgi:RNA 2',3'-cyclic 3'-phosphodiesterase